MTRIDWSGYDKDTQNIELGNNQISEMNWDGYPAGLQYINLSSNQISEMKWNGCPTGLEKIDSFNNQIINKEWTYKKYQSASKIARVYKYHYERRNSSALKIQRGCHNWIWNPLCKDGSIGIRPRLDMIELGIKK